MAAIAYPFGGVPPRRANTTGRRRSRRDRVETGHLRLVREPLFTEAIFAELESDARLASEWSVWHRPLPAIAHRQIVTTFTPAACESRLPSPGAFHEAPASALTGAAPRASSTLRSSTLHRADLPAVVASHRATRRVAPRYLLRRFVSCLALGAALFGGLSAASSLAATHQGAPVVIAGSVPVAGGYRYTVQAGDTLWSIASRVFPSGDPRALVSQLSAQIGGATAVPGEHLLLP